MAEVIPFGTYLEQKELAASNKGKSSENPEQAKRTVGILQNAISKFGHRIKNLIFIGRPRDGAAGEFDTRTKRITMDKPEDYNAETVTAIIAHEMGHEEKDRAGLKVPQKFREDYEIMNDDYAAGKHGCRKGICYCNLRPRIYQKWQEKGVQPQYMENLYRKNRWNEINTTLEEMDQAA